MKKNNKKGFTIVELVIVIAVIAILAAVLIPTFSSIIKKAKVNNDIQLIRNLNTAVASTAKKPETMHDAVEAAKDFGYDLVKIKASATDNEILWDSENNVFCYLKDGAIEYIPESVSGDKALEAKDYRLWKISDTVDADYSTYYTGNLTTIDTTKGFDAGDNTGITKINYENAGAEQKVVIRTNGGKLTVNADKDTVNHYGLAVTVDVKAVAGHSYYENGFVSGAIYVTKGHVVVKAADDTDKAGTLVVIKGVDVNIEVNDDTPVMLAAGITPTDETIVNGTKASENVSVQSIAEIKSEDELAKAFKNGGFCVLGADIKLATTESHNNYGNSGTKLHVPKGISLTLDLNGHKIEYGIDEANKTGVLVVHNGGSLTINDTVGTGEIIANNEAAGVALTRKGDDSSVPAKLVVNGGKITGSTYGICGNGSRQNTEISIYGGEITATDRDLGVGIYHPQNGKLLIAGGKISGSTGVYIKSGDLTADAKFVGGIIEAFGDKREYTYNGNGCNATGDALVVDNCAYPGGTPSVSLGNIILVSANAYQVGAYYTGKGDASTIGYITSTKEFKTNHTWESTVSGLYRLVEKK